MKTGRFQMAMPADLLASFYFHMLITLLWVQFFVIIVLLLSIHWLLNRGG